MRDFRINVFKRASLNRNFEVRVFDLIKEGAFNLPIYLSAGQEYISATISEVMKQKNIEPNIFMQHRGHSTYLSFEAPIEKLIDELLGRKTGCAYGMGGSASIHSKDKDIYGHDGLMGSQVPISVGHCYSTLHPTIVFMGDASAEEDYVLGALGWASTKNIPILFVVEDNNLSILTEKKIRRNWNMDDVARAFKMRALDINDDPIEIRDALEGVFDGPMLLNINTHRKFWHSGAGQDDENTFDRYQVEMNSLGKEAEEIHEFYKKEVYEAWQEQLEKQ
jgi:TPP-dependent pyruvate/acetoin dehydrogenase alpha subunit|tara:strand:- start:737 stop:1570 length:834 start_codon:yes stop_codon:yes gene_type:complete